MGIIKTSRVIWSPIEPGTKIEGVYAGIVTLKNGDGFKILDPDGNEYVVPRFTALKDVDLEPFKGKLVRFTFLGTSGPRKAKLFKVEDVEDDEAGKDGTPF